MRNITLLKMLKDTSSSTKKKANPKHTGHDSGESDNDDDESKIIRENNHVYFYSEVSRESIFKLNILLEKQKSLFIQCHLI